ncbi:MAG: orotate phosphoribosyltransferase [Candidatus Hinthialibacter antarcticus]|nr:orotate phosphoribosyltransferase [Candidatus Hinthialibacter antarcticus]
MNPTLAKSIHDVSNIRGTFTLRSGAVSNEYFDKYLFEADPVLLKAIGEEMKSMLPQNIDALAGLEMGGIPIATLLSQLTGIPCVFVRKEAKKYGTCKLAEGGDIDGKKLVIIEDVVTSGGQILLSSKDLRDRGAIIEDVLCVIDREAGGRGNLKKDGLELHPLFTMTQLKNAATTAI